MGFEAATLPLPRIRQATASAQPFDRKIDRLLSRERRFYDIWRQVGEREEPTDFVTILAVPSSEFVD